MKNEPVRTAQSSKKQSPRHVLQRTTDTVFSPQIASVSPIPLRKNASNSRPQGISSQYGVALIVLAAVMAVLGWRLFSLVLGGTGLPLASAAESNRVREIVSFSPRGKIYDRNGVVLADNINDFQLIGIPDELFSQDDGQLARDIFAIDQIDTESLSNSIDAVGESYSLPIVLLQGLSQEQAIAIEQQIPSRSSLSIQAVPIRTYATVPGLSHILGYNGFVTQEDLDNDVENRLHTTDTIGKTGIEYEYDRFLRGVNGVSRFEVDAAGSIVRNLGTSPEQAGQDVWLTIDIELQQALAEAVQRQMDLSGTTRGSAIATDPQTGEVLAMVSLPDFDNNLFARGISAEDFSELTNNPDQPLLNKVVSGGFTSGSVIKPLVAAAALQEGIVDPNTTIVDDGALVVPSENDPDVEFTFRGWRPEGLGVMNVRSALAWSSNIFFYIVAGGFEDFQGLGESTLTQYYRDFGLGSPTGIDLPGEITGLVPDAQWKQEVLGEEWFVGDTYNISIGQGDLIVSPLQIHSANSVVLNDGEVVKPQLLRQLGDQQASLGQTQRDLDIDDEHFQIIREGMRQVLIDGTTDGSVFADVPVIVAGKSGTAETNTPDGRDPHAWFTAFAPFDDPEIAITVLIEEGTGGSQFAAPAIAEAMEAYFTDRR